MTVTAPQREFETSAPVVVQRLRSSERVDTGSAAAVVDPAIADAGAQPHVGPLTAVADSCEVPGTVEL